ncbi:MAG: sugar-binding domain-containing protein [Bacteroidota bacterium]
MTSAFTRSLWTFLLCAPWVVYAQIGNPDFLAEDVPQKAGNGLMNRSYFTEVYKTTEEARTGNPQRSSFIQVLDRTWEVARNIAPNVTPTSLGISWQEVKIPDGHALAASLPRKDIYLQKQVHLYRTDFFIDPEWVGKQICLNTEGISGKFEIYINERFVALSNRSMLPSSFDISQVLKPGKNWLYIKLEEGSAGQFLEPGKGITQQPKLIVRPRVHLDRVRFQALALGIEGKAKWDLKLRVRQSLPVSHTTVKLKVEIWDQKDQQIWLKELRGKLDEEIESFEMDDVLGPIDYWSCETPNLYQVVVTLFDRKGRILESISQPVGFRKYQWRRGQFYVNGVETQLKGMTFVPGQIAIDQLADEMRLMKQHNINALWVRGFGSPVFYHLCDSLGFYVFPELGYTEKIGIQTARFAWRNIVIDHIGVQMEVIRGHAAFVQGVLEDPFSKPILGSFLRRSFSDLPWQDREPFQSYWVKLNIPKMLQEDIPEALWDTTAHLLAHNWNDQWIQHAQARSMKLEAAQAFKREPGYIDPQGKPRPSLLILKKWFEPIKLNLFPGSPSLVYVDNHYAFLSLESFKMVYKACTPNSILAVDTFAVRSILPGSLDQMVLPNRITQAWEGQPGAWLELNLLNPKGEEVAWTQLSTLGEEAVILNGLEAPKVAESASAIDIYGKGFHLTFDKGVGMLTAMELGGEEVWTGPLHLGFEWKPARQEGTAFYLTERPEQIQLSRIEVNEINKEIEVRYEGVWKKDPLSLPFVVMFSVLGNGRIYVDCQIKGEKVAAIIPRMQWQIPSQMTQAKWLGPGPSLPVNFFSRKGKWGSYEGNLEEDYFQIMGHLPDWEIWGVAQMSLCNPHGYGIKIYPLRDNAIYLSSQSIYEGTNTWLPVTSGTHIALYPSAEKAHQKSLLGGKRLTFRIDLVIPESAPTSSNRS